MPRLLSATKALLADRSGPNAISTETLLILAEVGSEPLPEALTPAWQLIIRHRNTVLSREVVAKTAANARTKASREEEEVPFPEGAVRSAFEIDAIGLFADGARRLVGQAKEGVSGFVDVDATTLAQTRAWALLANRQLY